MESVPMEGDGMTVGLMVSRILSLTTWQCYLGLEKTHQQNMLCPGHWTLSGNSWTVQANPERLVCLSAAISNLLQFTLPLLMVMNSRRNETSWERKVLGTKVPWNERSREQKFPGTFVPWIFLSEELSFSGSFVPPTILQGISNERRQL